VGTIQVLVSKTGKPRHVVLTEQGVEFFSSLCLARSGGDIMLLRSDGNPWRRGDGWNLIKETSARAKIDDLNFHALRHTWASHAVMNGVPLMVVARNMGHVDTRMVELHYGHMAPSFITDAIRKGAPRFGAGAKGNVRDFRRAKGRTKLG
jgi:integrase